MAIIYSYPAIGNVEDTDLFIISRTSSDNKTLSLTAIGLSDYVLGNLQIGIAGDSGTGTIGQGDTLSVLGTANNIVTIASGQSITAALTDDVNVNNNLTVGTNVVIKNDLQVDNDTSIDGDLVVNGNIEAGTLGVVGQSIMTDNLNMTLNNINNVADPLLPADAANKKYVDNAVTGLLEFKGTFNAATGEVLSGAEVGKFIYNCPGGAGTRIAVAVGDYYIVDVAGNFYCSGDLLNVGDAIAGVKDAAADASVIGDWSTLEGDNIEGSGVADTIPLWTDTQVLGDSILSQEVGTVYGTTKNLVVDGNIYQSNMSDSVSIGQNALQSANNPTGENIAIGLDSLKTLTVATNNVAIGSLALSANVTGNNNIAISKNALLTMGSGTGNISLGFNSGSVITSGGRNVILGHLATQNANVGPGSWSDNIILGASAFAGGTINNAVQENIAIGDSALTNLNNVGALSRVIMIGKEAGRDMQGDPVEDIGIGRMVYYGPNNGFTSAGKNIAIGVGAQGATSNVTESSIKIGSDAGEARSFAINIGTVDTVNYAPNLATADHGVAIGGWGNQSGGQAGIIAAGHDNIIQAGATGGAILGGYNNTVTGTGSAGMALGSDLEVNGNNQVVVGRYNVANNNSKFVVGAGFSNANRINAFEVKNTGLLKLGKYGQDPSNFAAGNNYNILVAQPNNEVREIDPVVFDSQILSTVGYNVGAGQVTNLPQDTPELVKITWTGLNGTATLRLPLAANFANKYVKIIADSSFNPTVVPSNLQIETSVGSGETIDGLGSYTISNQYEGVTLWCDGTEYFILNEDVQPGIKAGAAYNWLNANPAYFNFNNGVLTPIPFNTPVYNNQITVSQTAAPASTQIEVPVDGAYRVSLNLHFFDLFGDIDVLGGLYLAGGGAVVAGLIDQKDVTGNNDQNFFGQNVVQLVAGAVYEFRAEFAGGSGQSPFPADTNNLYVSFEIAQV